MPVEIEKTRMDGVFVVKTGIFHDTRGFFCESYSKKMYQEAGFREAFVQDNLSESSKGTLRGMHYQIYPDIMGKLVRCIRGAIFDVVVDLRKDSATFGQWMGQELSEANGLTLWVPPGLAHGFVALEDKTLVHYKCTSHHSPSCERTLSYKCPKIGIQWPIEPAIISGKDAAAPGLDEAEYRFGPEAQPENPNGKP